MSEDRDFEVHAALLRNRFKERLARDRERLLSSLAGLDAAQPQTVATAREIAHGLAGAAAIFGFPAIGGAAAALEEALEAGSREDLREKNAFAEKGILARRLIETIDRSLNGF